MAEYSFVVQAPEDPNANRASRGGPLLLANIRLGSKELDKANFLGLLNEQPIVCV